MKFQRRIASKLVRDKIPGSRYCYVDRAEHFTLLVAKLFEEAAEVARTVTNDELAEELGDVIEVALSLGVIRGISVEHIDNVRRAKAQEKGGFLRGVIQDGEWE